MPHYIDPNERPYDHGLPPSVHLENWVRRNGAEYEQEGDYYYAPNGAQCCPFGSGHTIDESCGLDDVPGLRWKNRSKYLRLRLARRTRAFDTHKQHLLNGAVFDGPDADLAKLKTLAAGVKEAAAALDAAERERDAEDPIKRAEHHRAAWEQQRARERADRAALINAVEV